MLKATSTNTTTVSANGTLPLNLVKNTFPYVTLKDNIVTINKAGVYQISATINATASTSEENIGLYNNNVLIPETDVSIDATSGDVYQIVINDIESVIPSTNLNEKVKLSLKTTSGIIVDTINFNIIELR